MSRYLTNWVIAAVLGAAGWAASSGNVTAQYIPPFGGGFPGVSPFFGSPYMMGTYRYSYVNPYTGGMQSYQYSPYGGLNGYSAYNPFTGRVMSYQANIPYYMAGGYGGGYAAPTYGGMASGSGGYGTSTNPITNQQLRQLRASSYQNAYSSGGYGDSRSAMSPRWTTANDKTTDKPGDVNEALLKSSENDILSARTLNALAIEIRKLEEKGVKAESPLLPAEVLSRVAYEGPGARLLTAARAGKPAFPRPLTGEQFAALRTELERHYVTAVEPFAQGKAIDAAAADRLAAAAEKTKADPALRQLSDGDAAATNKFLDGLVELSKQVKDPSLAGIYPKWGSTGATASELVRHMGRHKLLFAPAPAGSEEAYGALHRGLSGYYVALSRAKK